RARRGSEARYSAARVGSFLARVVRIQLAAFSRAWWLEAAVILARALSGSVAARAAPATLPRRLLQSFSREAWALLKASSGSRAAHRSASVSRRMTFGWATRM